MKKQRAWLCDLDPSLRNWRTLGKLCGFRVPPFSHLETRESCACFRRQLWEEVEPGRFSQGVTTHVGRVWQPTLVFLPGESTWAEEPGRLQSIGSQRVRHHWSDLAQDSTYHPSRRCSANMDTSFSLHPHGMHGNTSIYYCSLNCFNHLYARYRVMGCISIASDNSSNGWMRELLFSFSVYW